MFSEFFGDARLVNSTRERAEDTRIDVEIEICVGLDFLKIQVLKD